MRSAALVLLLASLGSTVGCASVPPRGLTKVEVQQWRETTAELKQAARQARDASRGVVRKVEQEWDGLAPRMPVVRLKGKWVYADKKERQTWLAGLFTQYNAILAKRGLPRVDRFLLRTPGYWEEWFPPDVRAGATQ